MARCSRWVRIDPTHLSDVSKLYQTDSNLVIASSAQAAIALRNGIRLYTTGGEPIDDSVKHDLQRLITTLCHRVLHSLNTFGLVVVVLGARRDDSDDDDDEEDVPYLSIVTDFRNIDVLVRAHYDGRTEFVAGLRKPNAHHPDPIRNIIDIGAVVFTDATCQPTADGELRSMTAVATEDIINLQRAYDTFATVSELLRRPVLVEQDPAAAVAGPPPPAVQAINRYFAKAPPSTKADDTPAANNVHHMLAGVRSAFDAPVIRPNGAARVDYTQPGLATEFVDTIRETQERIFGLFGVPRSIIGETGGSGLVARANANDTMSGLFMNSYHAALRIRLCQLVNRIIRAADPDGSVVMEFNEETAFERLVEMHARGYVTDAEAADIARRLHGISGPRPPLSAIAAARDNAP